MKANAKVHPDNTKDKVSLVRPGSNAKERDPSHLPYLGKRMIKKQ